MAHHPLLLRGVHAVDVRTPKGRMVTDLISADVALYCAHTNADVGADSTVSSLASALGLQDIRPLRPRAPTAADALDALITFVPADELDAVADALTAAGAGAVGDYDRCFFASPGTGHFRPLPGAHPHLGTIGSDERVAEQRLELVLPRDRRSAVVAALYAAHPYEQPAFDLIELAADPTRPATHGLGRVCRLAEETTLAEFAETVADAIPAYPGGVRVGGDPARPIRRVAVQAGAGDDLLDDARAAGVDVYVTSDLRHHPASEALAWPNGPALIDIAHWAAEWTWLPVVARLVEPLDVRIVISDLCTDPWTFVVHR